MPPLSSSPKRPGLWAWIGFGAVLIVTIVVIKTIFRQVSSGPTTSRTNVAVAPSGMMGYGGTDGMMDEAAVAPGMPPMAGMPLDRTMVKGSGSAAVDLDGKTIEPRIIKTGELSLRVEDTPKAVEEIRAIVTGRNGFVESSSISDSGEGPRSAWMTVRIPVQTFEATISQIKGVSVLVLNESIHGQDVTMEFVDLEADLRNAKAEEASYLEILKRSGDIEDVLAVTQRLAEVRGRIERIDGRKRYLENRTDLATLSISLTEETRVEVPSRTWRPLEVLRQALRDLVTVLQELVNFLIRLIVAIIGVLLPIALLVWLTIWIGWKVVRAVMRRMRK